MEPEQKANELIKKYLAFSCAGCDMPYCDACSVYYDETTAAEMAIIAVDEIIKECRKIDYWRFKFWPEVKVILESKVKR